MKSILASALIFLVAAAGAQAGAQTMDCKTFDLVGMESIASPREQVSDGLQHRVTVIIRLRIDGSFEDVKVDKSSQNLGYDRAAVEHAKRMRLSGVCLHQARGLLYIQYLFRAFNEPGKNEIEHIWRESSNAK